MADEYDAAPQREDRIEVTRKLSRSRKKMRKRGENGELAADLAHPSRWQLATRMSKQPKHRNFLNAPPLTRPGEGMVTNRPDGTVDVYWLGP